jgi:hypothetical protein
MKGQSLSHCKPYQVKGMIVANHELFHLSQVDLVFWFKMSYFFSCISKLLDKSFVGLTVRRDSGMLSLNRIFLRLLFLLHGKCLVYLIRFLVGSTFILLSLHRGFIFSYHRLLNSFLRGFIFSLQRYFSTFILMYRGFLLSFSRLKATFTLLPLVKVSDFSSTRFLMLFPFFF